MAEIGVGGRFQRSGLLAIVLRGVLVQDAAVEYKRMSVAYLLWFLLGPFGGHRFYLGQIGWGVFYVCTTGFFLIGWLVDLFMIPEYVRSYNRRVDFLRRELEEWGMDDWGRRVSG